MKVAETNATSFHEMTSLSPQLDGEKKDVGFALHQTFAKDSIGQLNQEKEVHAAAKEEEKSTWWSWLLSWIYSSEVQEEPKIELSQSNLLNTSDVEPISAVPTLTEPEFLPPELTYKRHVPTRKELISDKIKQDEISEALLKMKSKTMEQIMFFILKAQCEIEKERANVEDSVYSKYQDFQKVHDKALNDVKAALAADEHVAGRLETASNIAFTASVICGLCAAAASCGILALVGGIPLIGGVAAGVGSTLASIGPTVSALLVAFTSGSKAYFGWRVKNDKADLTQFNHQSTYDRDRLDEINEVVMSIAKGNESFEKQMIQSLKRFREMIRYVLQREK